MPMTRTGIDNMSRNKKRPPNMDSNPNYGYNIYNPYDNHYTRSNLRDSGASQKVKVQVADPEESKLISISKKGKFLLLGILLLIVTLCAGGYFLYLQIIGSEELLLKGDNIPVEVGAEIRLEPSLFVDTNGVSILAQQSITLNSSLMTEDKYEYNSDTKVVKTAGRGYLDVGEYPVKIIMGSQEKVAVLKVQDTKVPTITGINDDLVVEAKAQALKLEDYYTISDITKCTSKIEGDYDLQKAGEYAVEIVAKDESGNEMRKPITLHVLSASAVAKDGGASLMQTIDGNTPVSKETEKKIVAGKIKGITSPTGFEKNKISKGVYSDPVEQAKAKAQEEIKKAQEEALKASKEGKGGQTSSNYQTSQTNQNYPANQTSRPNNSISQTPKKATGPKPQGDYVDEKGVLHTDLFTSHAGAKSLMNWYQANGQGSRLAGGYDEVTGESLMSKDGRVYLYKVYPN